MKGGQIAALVIGCLLLLPGGCFMLFGIGLASDTSDNLGGAGWMLIGIALAILAFAGLLFWIAFRKRGATPAGASSSPPPAEPPA
jgi:membrane protein implicated in regulation of membrane protease activity